MRGQVLALALVALAAMPQTPSAQALPDVVRAAGVTIADWRAVQVRIRRSAAENHVSERALAAVCQKMGVELAKGGRLDLNQLISLVDGRAEEIIRLNQRLEQDAQRNTPGDVRLEQSAVAAVETGDLDSAEHQLDQAESASQLCTAEITAFKAEIHSLRFDYLGAAQLYARAAATLPDGATHQRWTYLVAQASALQTRGDLFVEPEPLREAVRIYRDLAMPLVPREAGAFDWAETQTHLGFALLTLGERGDDQALKDALATLRLVLEVRPRDRDPAGWALAQDRLGIALSVLGQQRGDDQALNEAVAAFRAALEVRTRERDPAGWAETQSHLGFALRVRGEQGDPQASRDAVAAFRSALEVTTRDRDPDEWAAIQKQLGNALEGLGDRQALIEAVAAFRSDLEVNTRDRDPAEWSYAQNSLGTALRRLESEGTIRR